MLPTTVRWWSLARGMSMGHGFSLCSRRCRHHWSVVLCTSSLQYSSHWSSSVFRSPDEFDVSTRSGMNEVVGSLCGNICIGGYNCSTCMHWGLGLGFGVDGSGRGFEQRANAGKLVHHQNWSLNCFDLHPCSTELIFQRSRTGVRYGWTVRNASTNLRMTDL